MKTGPLVFTLLVVSMAGCVSTPAGVCTEEDAASDARKQRTYYFKDEIEPDAASGSGGFVGAARGQQHDNEKTNG